MAQKVSEVMTGGPVTADVSTSVQQVAQMMRDQGIGDVVVTDENGVCGLVTDRDIVVRGLAVNGDPTRMTVGDICSRNLVAVNADDDIDEAVRIMREHAVRRLPVTRDQQLVGMVSIGDLAVDQDRRSALADISAAPPNT
ncbi:CBS domain-containing protein [Phytoactinopolyspora halotolerans]|uniref:CBS domain-containing protein n=1 Tax=Phytoactinopolyspora halotolerans TaxID=1981512 RepID=A0A6L9S4P6_9ACTN|nr:CBS domain-containing protein [Phytoactinopolyspora halotolerans]NED99976.1 CBS domain-containing protein [Phytoactinopolyspora halotolerans]